MKFKTALFTGAFCCMGLYMQAQTTPTMEKTNTVVSNTSNESSQDIGKKITDFLDKRLDLTAVQYQRVSALTDKLISRVRKIRSKEATKEVRAAKMKKTMELYDAEMKKILDGDQCKKYLAAKKDVREHYKEMREDE